MSDPLTDLLQKLKAKDTGAYRCVNCVTSFDFKMVAKRVVGADSDHEDEEGRLINTSRHLRYQSTSDYYPSGTELSLAASRGYADVFRYSYRDGDYQIDQCCLCGVKHLRNRKWSLTRPEARQILGKD